MQNDNVKSAMNECQKRDSNPRPEDWTATWTQALDRSAILTEDKTIIKSNKFNFPNSNGIYLSVTSRFYDE